MGGSLKRWAGTGFNLIWRPNRDKSGPTGNQDFFLQLKYDYGEPRFY
jgi:hypothetical protein